MAKEHIYTRANEGFFNHAEGYDTIALSKGLTKEYVLKNIYPFCFYKKNTEDDCNLDIYYYKYIQNPNFIGDAVIFGKNSYIYSSRNYILSNSIIICDKNEIDKLDESFEQFIEFDGYSKTPSSPCILDDINICKYFKTYNVLKEKEFIFNLFSLTENDYKYLLYNIINCVEKKETFYIKLDCKKNFYSRYAKKLIKILFINIPASLKKKLSYITYSSDFNLTPFFHIAFIDNKLNIKQAQYNFDFCNKPTFNKNSCFINFALENIILSNELVLKSNLYKNNYQLDKLIIQLDNAQAQLLDEYKYRFKTISTKLSLNQYIDIINLFFDLRFFCKDSIYEWANKLNTIKSNNNDLKKQIDFKDIYDFLIMKSKQMDKKSFIKIAYEYYLLDFNNIEFIIDKINNLNNLEDFFILAFFYINYTEGLLNQNTSNCLIDTIIKKALYLDKQANIRKENIDGLSVYLWKRYRDWI